MWLWVPSVNYSTSSFVLHCGSFNFNKSLSIFENVVPVCDYIVKVHVKYFFIECLIKRKQVQRLIREKKCHVILFQDASAAMFNAPTS